MAYNILQSLKLLSDGCRSFTKNAILGIKPNHDRINHNLHNSLMLVTALNPHIGYDKAAKAAKKAFNEKISLKEAVVKLGFLSTKEFDKYVNPEEMIYPKKKTK